MEGGLPAVSTAPLSLFQIKNVPGQDVCLSSAGSQHSHGNKLLHWATDGCLQGMHWWSPSLHCSAFAKMRKYSVLILRKNLPSQASHCKNGGRCDCPSPSVLHQLPWTFVCVEVDCSDSGPRCGGCPGRSKPDCVGSSLMLEELLGRKRNAKDCLQGLGCATTHTPTCSELQLPVTESAGGTERKSSVFSKI